MKKNNLFFLIACTLSLFLSPLSAEITLPKVFTNNMVLQQQVEAPLWGKAKPNKEVTLITSWDKKTYKTKADDTGKWSIKVITPVAGGPYSISISDGKKLLLNDILIGEVWVCSGQSNMQMPLAGWGKVDNYKNEIAQANYPQIRLFHVEKATSTQPLDDLKATRAGWQVCSPETVGDFSSVAYFFGRNLHENMNVPIGLISTSWGGTVAEAWTSGDALEYMPYFKEAVDEIKTVSEEDAQKLYLQKLKEWNNYITANDKGFVNAKPVWAEMNFDDKLWNEMTLPGLWEKKGLDNFDGIVWFRKTIEIPQNWVGKDLELKLAMIDDNDITYFNGEQIGETDGYDKKRIYRIPGKFVKSDKAVITVRVLDTSRGGGIYGEITDMSIALQSEKERAQNIAGTWKYQPTIDLNKYNRAPTSVAGNPNYPTALFNAMINPLIPYAIRGAIWYQGEANVGRASQYSELLPIMIRDWRKHWNKDFPFYFVQLANYLAEKPLPEASEWAELRDAQLQALHLENTGIAVAIDIGEAEDIHPKNKQEVGRRLALNARAKTYGERIVFSGPIYKSHKIESDKVRAYFDHAASGLKTNDGGKVKGFAIAGADHIFHWADAVIQGSEIIISSPDVKFPIAVRYAWADNPDCNLYNVENLPASPFRTDDFKDFPNLRN